MKRYFYFVAMFLKQGTQWFSSGVQETDDGYFDFVGATESVAEENDVDIKKVVVTFWTETNSVMMGRFNTLRRTNND